MLDLRKKGCHIETEELGFTFLLLYEFYKDKILFEKVDVSEIELDFSNIKCT